MEIIHVYINNITCVLSIIYYILAINVVLTKNDILAFI